MMPDRRILPMCAGLGFIVCGLGLAIDPKPMLASYLVAWTAISAIPIGAIAVLFTSYLVRGGWTPDLHEPLSATVLTLPAVAVLFVPLLFGMGEIYSWVFHPEGLPVFKAAYLVPWFFVLRAILYFVIWTALAVWAVLAYGREAAMIRAASAGLIVWSLVTSLAGIDWLESLEPDFHSSIYGFLAIAFDLLAGLAFAILTVMAKRSQKMSNASYAAALLSVLLLWAYLHAMQYIIIWSGNLPDEVVWYLKRMAHGWKFALWGVYILQFVLPFFALLSSRVRSSTIGLLWLSGGTLALRFVEAAVLILPTLNIGILPLLLDLPAAILAAGAGWLWAFRITSEYLVWRSERATAAAH